MKVLCQSVGNYVYLLPNGEYVEEQAKLVEDCEMLRNLLNRGKVKVAEVEAEEVDEAEVPEGAEVLDSIEANVAGKEDKPIRKKGRK